MTTIATGNIVIQNGNERRWEIGDSIVDSFGNTRWEITVIDIGIPARNPGRITVGTVSTASEDWLNANCTDWEAPVVLAPQGDGTQAAAIFDGDNMIDHELFQTLSEMLRWSAEKLSEHPDAQGRWYGWDVDADDLDEPDMTFTLVEGELVWCE